MGGNKAPIANAGPDHSVQLPDNSSVLNGSASKDPDGRIVAWSWRKISGPASFTLNGANDSISHVSDLVIGAYEFELSVKDNGGLSASDTVKIIVNDPRQPNRPPVADAGSDTTISLPANTIVLDGTGSSDPDNNIAGYEWKMLTGTGFVQIADKNRSKTSATGLAEGTYDFTLVVTDSGGLADADTMRVTVKRSIDQQICGERNRPEVMARLIPVGNLSKARQFMSVASVGNKIFFAGGYDNPNNLSADIDIFDAGTNTWSTAKLCCARNAIGTVSSGNKVFFAGGETGDGTLPVDSVDIYDATTNTWSVSHLSKPGNGIAAAAIGSKVLFAGGDGGVLAVGRETTVDIFDMVAGKWSTATLSDARRMGHSAVVVGTKVYIAGGELWNSGITDHVDIYDEVSGSWSYQKMIEGKALLAGIAANTKIYWAGGFSDFQTNSKSCSVIEYDTQTGISQVSSLSGPKLWFGTSGQNAVIKNNKVLFLNHNDDNASRFDIYDLNTGLWSIGVLDKGISYYSVISLNNEVYLAGGNVNGVLSDKVWKLDF